MNLFFVYGSGPDARIMTPALTGTLLPGVTRDSLLTLAPDLGIPASEGAISVEQWRAGCESGEITEVFACGTAAVITPVGAVKGAAGGWTIGGGAAGPGHRCGCASTCSASSSASCPTRTAGCTRSARSSPVAVSAVQVTLEWRRSATGLSDAAYVMASLAVPGSMRSLSWLPGSSVALDRGHWRARTRRRSCRRPERGVFGLVGRRRVPMACGRWQDSSAGRSGPAVASRSRPTRVRAADARTTALRSSRSRPPRAAGSCRA